MTVAKKSAAAKTKATVPARAPAAPARSAASRAQSRTAAKSEAKAAAPAAKPGRPEPTDKLPKSAVVAKPVLPEKADKPQKAEKVEKVEKADKARKPKLVRDSFTIPKAEYQVLDELKERAARLAHPAKKSELLRAGIKALAGMADAALLAALQAVPAIKTGRPKASS